MSLVKEISKQLKYYIDVGRREEGFDLSTADLPHRTYPQLKSLPVLPYDRQPGCSCGGNCGFTLVGHLQGPQVFESQMNPDSREREHRVKVEIERNITNTHFLRTNQRFETCRRSPVRESARSSKGQEQAFRGGYPMLRTRPPAYMSRSELHRMITVTSKLLVYTEGLGKKMDTGKGSLGSEQRNRKRKPRTRSENRTGRHPCRKSPPVLEESDSDSSVRSGSPSRARSPSLRRISRSNSRDSSSSSRSHSASRASSPNPRERRRSRSPSATPRSESTTKDLYDYDNTAETQAQTDVSLMELDHTVVTRGEEVDYIVVTRTGRGTGSTCEADVSVILYGDNGCSAPLQLNKSLTHHVPFQKGHTDEFRLRCCYVGALKAVHIGHDHPGYSWLLEDVVVKCPSEQQHYEFACRRWLSTHEKDGKSKLTLRISDAAGIVGSGR